MAKKANWGEDPFFSGPRDWFRNSLIFKEVKLRKSSCRVLDFGCGSGDLIIRLVKDGYYVVGVDKSNLVVEFLKTRFIEEGVMNKAEIVKGTEKELSKLRDRFDVVVSGETLEHLKDDLLAVKGFYKVLRRNGVCIITTPAHMHFWNLNDEYSSHFRRYDKAVLLRMFEKVGFKVEKIYYWGFPLARLWERYIYLPLIKEKMKSGAVYSNNHGLISSIVRSIYLKRIFSIFFAFDNLFNWTQLGGGIVLVARK